MWGHVPLSALRELGETALLWCEEPSGKGGPYKRSRVCVGGTCVVTATGGGEAAVPAGRRRQGPTEARSAGLGQSARQRAGREDGGDTLGTTEKRSRPGAEAAPEHSGSSAEMR